MFWGGILSLLSINVRYEIQIESSVVNMSIQSLGVSLLILLCYIGSGKNKQSLMAKLGNYGYEFYISHFVILLGCKSIASNAFQFWILALVLTLIMTVILHQMQIKFFNRLLK